MKFVSIESGIASAGFRKLAAIAKEIVPDIEICFIPTDNLYSFKSHFFPEKESMLKDSDIDAIASHLAEADVIGFSCMSASAVHTEKIVRRIKEIKPSAFLLWGGVHPTLYPEESIAFVDAICIGEGERPFRIFLEKACRGETFTEIPGMWFKNGDVLIKNRMFPLNAPEMLGQMPHSYLGDSMLYNTSTKKFRLLNHLDYANYNGLLFRTLWTLGCPYSCSYCANDSFIKFDPGYRKLRYPPVDYILEEIKIAVKKYPFISTVAFYDDNFITLPLEILKEFSEKYKKEVGLPFAVFGMHPNFVRVDKVELLAEAGMNRTRMGIQSGSERTLKFFNRKTEKRRVVESAGILADIAKKHKMIPPSYDVISDNPVETVADMIETLELLYDLERPFTLTVFSLRVFPKTALYDYVQGHPSLREYFKNSSYLDTRKNLVNITLYLLATGRPPRFVFSRLLSAIKKQKGEPKEYPVFFRFIKLIYLSKRAMDHLSHFDFSTMVGKWTYDLWFGRHMFLTVRDRFKRWFFRT